MDEEGAAHYREKAVRARAKAEKTTSPGVRTSFLVIARHYDKLAEYAENDIDDQA